MIRRIATAAEIFHSQRYIRRTRFRHFIKEIYNPRAKNGVSHRRHSSAALRDIDGVPHVTHNGERVAITATHYTLDTGLTFITSIRVDSPYLPE
jgi:hypothetical protein